MSASTHSKTGIANRNLLDESGAFVRRHIGPGPRDLTEMLNVLGLRDLDALVDATVPESIRTKRPLALGTGRSEHEVLGQLRGFASENRVARSYIGMGYYDCVTPPVILRNILENPGWYTQYTPYQPEISQGRLEALLNFQTLITDMTGLEIANASLLDEGTAAAEAMSMCFGLSKTDCRAFFVSDECHPQTIDVVKTRAGALGIEVITGDHRAFDFSRPVFGVLVQYPASEGTVCDYSGFFRLAHERGAMTVVAADLLALAILRSPAEFGADVAVGNTQRFGVPMGFGGPHAAYLATREAFKRTMPGRLVGVSRDAAGKPALRLSLQTREQHIRREKATSNICTAQVLLAVIAGMYAVYHGPEGVRKIAERIRLLTAVLAEGLRRLGLKVSPELFFDTVRVDVPADTVIERAAKAGMRLRRISDTAVGVSLDETTGLGDVHDLLGVFAPGGCVPFDVDSLVDAVDTALPPASVRRSGYLTHPVFNRYHSETELLRYMKRLESRDLSLTASMIPLGSCTMKLNAAVEMLPITWPEFGRLHPFVPESDARGYRRMFAQLESWLSEITGFAAVSLQPNAGSQGEYAGLLVIRRCHEARGQGHRNVCLIPQSAHGTNPASAVMAGLRVVVVACDDLGNIDVPDLRAKASKYAGDLAALMVTYPSTHGVFEEAIREICDIVHGSGGLVYMDGANLNAQVGLCRPGDIGADVCHMNLHKTFCIPHGGGGPGMGPIAVSATLQPYLPGHTVIPTGGDKAIGAVSAAPYGSPSVLPISWAYIAMMGGDGLKRATEMAILNANYIARRLDSYYPVLYKGKNGFVAHECILDLRPLKKSAGIEVDDIAKRLMDYGFHAPTVSFPVAGTLMVEPTESESKYELDRFCDAMIAIRQEIAEIENGRMDPENNPLKNAPHTAEAIVAADWNRPYSRELAAFPSPATRDYKFWPSVARIDAVYGDRNLFCTCRPVEEYAK